MKKIILLTVILLVVITFSGCDKKKDANSNEAGNESSVKTEMETGKIVIKDNTEEGKGSILDSIKEIVNSDEKMKCTYISNEDGSSVKITTYVQGNKYKTEFLMNSKSNHSIFDGKISYSWEDGSKQGIKIDTECLESLSEDIDMGDFEDMNREKDSNEIVESSVEMFDGAQNIECHETGAIDFSVPQNIEFVDQCEMLKKQQEMINDFTNQIPEGMPSF